MNFLKTGLLVAGFFVFIAACDQAPAGNNAAGNATNATTNTAKTGESNTFSNMPVNVPAEAKLDEMASGRKIYMEICANCHRDDGSGGKITIEGKTIKPDNLTTDKMKKMADAKYVDYIKNGVIDEGMPAFKDKLSDEEINHVIAFIRKDLQAK